MSNKNILSPFQKFVKIESLSGLLLLGATLIALFWANSSWSDTYYAIWEYKIGFTSEAFELNKPLILWVNDGLMAVFFFLIGLEIKREFIIGELNSAKKVAFPLFGALGGMLFPVLFYFILNKNPETIVGWGVPMATDIAFALAVLKLLGDKIPLSLKVFLTAFAIVDDIGAVMVIAIFYSENIQVTLLVIACIMLLFLYILSYKGYYSKFVLFTSGIIIWTLFLKAGIHPTLAGILLAFAIPIRQKASTNLFIENLESIAKKIKESADLENPVLSDKQIEEIDNLEDLTEQFQSPLQHLEHKLHDWVAYFIIPIFALANAGVMLNSDYELNSALIINLILCLVLGNSVGITFIVFLAKKLKFVQIPKDINNMHIVGVSFLAGIGFTMAIFIASLAFKNSPAYIDSAKIGILLGSLISALIGYIILKLNSTKN